MPVTLAYISRNPDPSPSHTWSNNRIYLTLTIPWPDNADNASGAVALTAALAVKAYEVTTV